jgi:hypothetical protein
MKYILFILFVFSLFAKAQILTDSFNSFPFNTSTGQNGWIFINNSDTVDLIASVDLTPFAFSAGRADELTAGSIVYKDSHYVAFNGSNEYYTGTDTPFDLPSGTDACWMAWFLSPASISGAQDIFGKNATGTGWWTNCNTGPTSKSNILFGGTQPQNSISISLSTHYFVATTCDRDGNMITYLFGPDSLATDTADASPLNGNDLGNANNVSIGKNAGGASGWFAGGIHAAKWYKGAGSVISGGEVRKQAFLAEGWKAGGGDLYRVSWGWHQGFLNTGGGVLSVGLKGGTQSNMSTISGDSTRYTIQLSGVTSLSSDSLIFVGGGDSVWVGLPDSTFSANRGLQIVFDCWQLGKLTPPIGTFAYIDNVTVTTYAVPAAAASTDSEFQEHSDFSEFKGF